MLISGNCLKTKTMYKKIALLFLLQCVWMLAGAQSDRWQQGAEYNMDIDFDVKKHRFTGTQELTYYNNSPDTLTHVFYHLYFNAFQPGSMMDVRSRTIIDPDPRVGGRISELSEDEIGYLHAKSLKHEGKKLAFEEVGTILEVKLEEPILPNSKTTFSMEFEGQVPLQIRRNGRNNAEGIDYSMAQWYPKMTEYDYQGWHANPYIGREFYGIWGTFDVTIHIDKSYVVAASGYLQNPEEIGYGYEDEGMKVKRPKGDKLHWHFVAPNVHDFAWAADPDFTHTKKKAADGPMMHFFFQKNENTEEGWGLLPDVMDKVFSYVNTKYGKYPFDKYSFIQAGDGGMEYAMATFITGERSFPSLVGVSVHELMHSWYQMILGTNESLYAWMDEGFTSYSTADVMNYLRQKGIIPGKYSENPHLGSVRGYANFALSGVEEPLSTHADHFIRNQAYGVASYVKGAVFLHQIRYIIGKEDFDKGMLRYFKTWKFKHPNTNDFIRVMEKQSGLELDWYKEYWVNTTHTIDYGIKEVKKNGNKTTVVLKKIGLMPMPLDVMVTLEDDSRMIYNIPLRIMRGAKEMTLDFPYEVAEDWPWTNPEYELSLDVPLEKIKKIQIDPRNYMADVERENNEYPAE